MFGHLLNSGQEPAQMMADRLFANHLVADLDSLSEGENVRRGKDAGRVSGPGQDGVEERTDGSLAVRARNMNREKLVLRVTELLEQMLCVRQSKLRPEEANRIEVFYRVCVVHTRTAGVPAFPVLGSGLLTRR